MLKGDFGTSLLYRQPVISVIGQRLVSSFWLLLSAWVISGVLGLAMGVVAGAFRGRWPDRLIRGYCFLISSTPAFWLAILLLLIFAVWLGCLPIGLSVPAGMDAAAVTAADRLRHAILPALTLSITGVANIALHTREKMIDVLESDYVLFARARGESEYPSSCAMACATWLFRRSHCSSLLSVRSSGDLYWWNRYSPIRGLARQR